ncbi:glycosyltransferase-like isoform X1, partial [Leptotrombidium deliense]
MESAGLLEDSSNSRRSYFTLSKGGFYGVFTVVVILATYYLGNAHFFPKLKSIENYMCWNNSCVNLSIEGGHYIPVDRKSGEVVAIIIPQRGREMHLKIFLRYMHPFLMKQQIEYGIYVIEQTDDGKLFNRAK